MNWNIDVLKKPFFKYPDPDKLNILLNSDVTYLLGRPNFKKKVTDLPALTLRLILDAYVVIYH